MHVTFTTFAVQDYGVPTSKDWLTRSGPGGEGCLRSPAFHEAQPSLSTPWAGGSHGAAAMQSSDGRLVGRGDTE